ncbi:dihydropyrimidine dehydrogenase [Biomaibacter acetigenes]|uniref:Dihydropyrimidine dehydrogenase n=2 Tax=Biomaibacter acetigenes TaxID=2316383 RepID=A0A3G2R1C1_9FIRM|nr:dihydropyrimidine dehydrogenase [Biomaibacter acetigenes]RKL64561.1 dihydropyrimidine dehydrogenase [Thermoanaerobacteraceae bacterium SP2]
MEGESRMEDRRKFSREQALIEAERCLYCYDAPCEKACPAHVPVPEFIQSVRTGNLKGARNIIREANPFIEICGVICPEFCSEQCIRGKIDTPINVRQLHKFVTDNTDPEENLEPAERTGQKVAIVGGGPAGLSCARELSRLGYKPVILEKDVVGGIPAQEIARTRLDEEIAGKETGFIVKHFVEEVKRAEVEFVGDLLKEYGAVFISTGLEKEQEPDIPGTDLEGVFFAREILKNVRKGQKSPAGRRVGVIGGGNVALETAAVLKAEDPGRDVEVIYRRGLKELKAFREEIEEAVERGVTFQFMAIPREIRGDAKVEGIMVTRARLSEPDESGRRRPEPVENSDFFIPLDTIIIAIGQKAGEKFPEIEKTAAGLIKVNDKLETNIPGVFAGGDMVNGACTVVESVRDGKKAAASIAEYLERGKA